MTDVVLQVLLAILIGGFLLSAVDDLAVDLLYWVNRLLGRHRRLPISRAELASVPQQRVAILVPAWHEHDVIREMLTFNADLIDYDRYDFFVGTYPNDEATVERVRAAQRMLANVHMAMTPHPGPTNKADNLNSMFAAVQQRERQVGERYAFVVLHDPEDVLHPFELKLYNHHFASATSAMVQTPIFPLPARPLQFTAGTYMDEFAELHSKDMHVREWVSGFVPSAGVGTAIRRDVLDRLAATNGGAPFATDSLTEDYDLGFRLAHEGLAACFLSRRLADPPEGVPELIATRAPFPDRALPAVRQRTRWTLGIVFQNWKNRSWSGPGSTRWLLFRDRKSVATNALVAGGYLLVLYVVVYLGLRSLFFPHWPDALPDRAWIRLGFTILLFVMAHRLLQRAIATARVYGIGQGLLAIPRQVWSNLINVRASMRAAWQFGVAEWRGVDIAWDKTQHRVPAVAANGDARRVGEILRGWGLLTPSQMEQALVQQEQSGRPLGDELVDLGYITRTDLLRALRVQAGDEELPYSTMS